MQATTSKAPLQAAVPQTPRPHTFVSLTIPELVDGPQILDTAPQKLGSWRAAQQVADSRLERLRTRRNAPIQTVL